jgi:choline dehydrogenase
MIQTAVDDAALVPVAQNGSDPLAHLAFEGPVHRYAELVLQDVPASDERLDRRFEVCGHVSQAHGVAGPIPVIRYPNVTATEFDDAVQQALRECQFEWVPDLNRPGAVGFGRMPMNSIDGRRLITVDLLTKPRPNLELRADLLAAAVVFDGQRATGIRLSDGSTVHASTAVVVLAAGVYGSPCLLMRSGIGPGGVLAERGIPSVLTFPAWATTSATIPLFLSTSATAASNEKVRCCTRSQRSRRRLPRRVRAQTSHCGPATQKATPAEGRLEVVLLRPKGSGCVRLPSIDPAQQPRIWLPTFTDEDVLVLSQGVRRTLDVRDTSALQTIRSDPEGRRRPSCRLDPWVRENAYSLPHTVGTCAMGASPDSGAVVDAAGQVHGLTACTSWTRRSCRAHQPDFCT